MHRIRFFLLLFLCGLFLENVNEKTAGEKYAADFQVLVTSLKELHPILYKNIGKAEFDREVIEITERLKHTGSRYKAIYMMQELMFRIHNAHAGNVSVYSIGNDTTLAKVLPFNVYIIGKQLYIKNYPADTSYNGAKIYSIGKTGSETLVDSLKIFFPVDGNRDIVDFYLQPYFNCLYAAFCSQRDTFEINTEKGMLKAAAAKKGTPLFHELVLNKEEPYLGKERVLKKEITTEYGYFMFSGFVRKYKTYRIESDFDEFMKELNEKQIQNVIIDLRHNEGGDPIMGAEMVAQLVEKPFRIFEDIYDVPCKKPTYVGLMSSRSYFKMRDLKSEKCDTLRRVVRFENCLRERQPSKERFKGKIYILTGSVTKSASTMFCSYLQGQSNVVFVGEETAGAVNYFWAGGPDDAFCALKLPNLNTVFAFGIELLEIKKGSSTNESQAGLIPDQKVSYTIADKMEGRDKEMEWVKSDIAGRK